MINSTLVKLCSIILWVDTVLLLWYKQCGLADHSVVEDVNKLQILFFFILSSLWQHCCDYTLASIRGVL